MHGSNSEEKETGTQINDLEQKEEINIQQNRTYIRIQKKKKNRERLWNLWDNFKHSNIHIIGIPEEEEEQEVEHLFELIMKENYLYLVKEIDMEVREAQSPKELEPKEEHNKIHHN